MKKAKKEVETILIIVFGVFIAVMIVFIGTIFMVSSSKGKIAPSTKPKKSEEVTQNYNSVNEEIAVDNFQVVRSDSSFEGEQEGDEFPEDELTDCEKDNAKLILNYEKKKGYQ